MRVPVNVVTVNAVAIMERKCAQDPLAARTEIFFARSVDGQLAFTLTCEAITSVPASARDRRP
jgi:hypothetical protein